MDKLVLVLLACSVMSISAWSVAHYPRAPLRVVRYAIPPHPASHHRMPARVVRAPAQEILPEREPQQPLRQRPKRGHDYDYGDHDHGNHGSSGVTGPVHTFVKTDKNANYKWGVRHHVGDKFAS